MEQILPIFNDLIKPEMLFKCNHGGIQKVSELMSNIIWSRLQKTTFVFKDTLEVGIYTATAT